MITVPLTAIGIATGCLLVGGFIWTVQTRVRNEIALGQEFVLKKRAMVPQVTDDDFRREIKTLKAQLAVMDASRQDLFNYLLQLEKTMQQTVQHTIIDSNK